MINAAAIPANCCASRSVEPTKPVADAADGLKRGFGSVRRAAESPLNLVLEARA